jgi:hypothetical protein
MENKINVYELLKACPKGMELDSPVWNNIVFEEIDEDNIVIFRKSVDAKVYLTQYGEVNSIDGNCVIYPKGKTTWEGFIPPCKFKAGDVLVSETGNIVLFSHIDRENIVHYHCIIPTYGSFRIEENTSIGVGRYYECVLANEQQRQRMYDKIKCSGYKYNQSTNTLEKLVKPIFKVGDIVRSKNCRDAGNFTIVKVGENKYSINLKNYCIEFKDQDNYELVSDIKPKFKVGDRIVEKNGVCVPILISNVSDEFYYTNTESSVGVLPISKQDEWELVPNKFDINTLVPFESRVLVRDNVKEKWHPGIWGYYDNDTDLTYPYKLIGVISRYCIPYERNEHLLGKTDDCDEYFKTWE